MNPRLIVSFLFIGISAAIYTQDYIGSEKKELKATLSTSLNSNGIASIPAFSLGAPAFIASAQLVKGRLSFDPVLAYGIDMKPWYLDSWFHYMIINRSRFRLRTGYNFSNFFSEYKLPDKTLMQSERYWAFEIAGMINLSTNTILTLMYWRDSGRDPGTIKGHFINGMIDYNNIPLGKHLISNINLMLFYVAYDGPNDGLFISPKVAAGPVKVPFQLFIQATQPFSTNISPNPGFRWNAGVAFTF
jgi:hypothetical protein